MRFEARELKPYAEPVPPAELKEGSVYFAVNYCDEEMHIPLMETLVFAGRDLDEDDSGMLYFQDINSYREGIRFESATEDDDVTFFQCAEDEAKHIFEYEQALNELMRCSLRRKGIEGTG
jgi:hypothetical protein